MEDARRRAKSAGVSQYKSSKPCTRGHANVRRYTSNAICVQCDNEVLAPRRRANKRARSPGPKIVVGVCEHCGIAFEKSNNANRHCSMECRYWSKVEKRGADECWPWLGAIGGTGHGHFKLNATRSASVLANAQRISYELNTGIKVSEMKPKHWGDLYVCHTCDNPSCVNPSHLYLGTHFTNMQDKVDRGRALSRTGYRKYADRVGEVLALHATGISQMKIADKTGINQYTISQIVRGVYLRDS